MNTPVLEVENLTTSYGQKVHPLRGVSFSLSKGQSLGIVGESGSGKSVLLRSIVGIHPRTGAPTVSGSVYFEGSDLLNMRSESRNKIIGRRIGYIHQDPLTSLHPLKRVEDLIMESPSCHDGRLSRKDRHDRAAEMLSKVGFPEPEEILKRYPHEMSGGQRQRIGIAAALVENPALIIADEPTTALDVTVQAKVLDLLEDLRAQNGSSLILVTHDLAIVGERCDWVGVMYAGRLVELAPADELINSPQHPYTQGLLQARPKLRGELPRRQTAIPGVAAPPSRSLNEGCPFARRCPLAESRCQKLPILSDNKTPGHSVACVNAGVPVDYSIATVNEVAL